MSYLPIIIIISYYNDRSSEQLLSSSPIKQIIDNAIILLYSLRYRDHLKSRTCGDTTARLLADATRQGLVCKILTWRIIRMSNNILYKIWNSNLNYSNVCSERRLRRSIPVVTLGLLPIAILYNIAIKYKIYITFWTQLYSRCLNWKCKLII